MFINLNLGGTIEPLASLFRGTVASIVCFLLLHPAFAADDLLTKAAGCGDFDSCFEVMLQATDPRRLEPISVAAARIGELQKPPKGNRKAARDLNAKGLSEFKKDNFADAAKHLQQAANEDPSDVEVQSNLGLALLRANQLAAAQVALKTALAINPRRTSAWVPMAEYFFEAGDSVKAVASLLLAYEFSENREKTRTFFDSKAGTADRNAVIYTLALKKLNELPRSTIETARIEAPKAKQSTSVTKNDAKAMLIEKISSDPDFRNDPFKKEFAICAIEGSLDETFGSATMLDAATFERRISEAVDRMKAGMKSKDSDVMFRIMKCVINSKAFEQSVKEKSGQDKHSSAASPAPSLPLLDMDDLRLDMASLDGRKVRVRGIGHYMMDMFMLKKSMTDMSPIIINISKLAREQRRHIIQECSDIMSGCRVTVIGTVGKVSYQNGIFAENVEW